MTRLENELPGLAHQMRGARARGASADLYVAGLWSRVRKAGYRGKERGEFRVIKRESNKTLRVVAHSRNH